MFHLVPTFALHYIVMVKGLLECVKNLHNILSVLQVSCGQTLTIAISEDGTRVFGFGKSDHCAFGSRRLTGDHYHPMVSC